MAATTVIAQTRRAYRTSRDIGQRLVDFVLRVRTADRVVDVLDVDEEIRRRYRASGWFSMVVCLRKLRPTRDDVLLDVGSGLGRSVLVARRFPFKRVIGVEYSPGLHGQALLNLEYERWPGRAPVELVCADATTFPIPHDVNVVYLYNSVNDEVFASLLSNLLASLAAHPRALRVAYNNPVEEHHLIASGRFRRTGVVRGSLRPTAQWGRTLATHFYEYVPPLTRVADLPR